MSFSYDYGAVTRWVLEQGLDAVTIEPTGRVVFSTFDHNPAMFAGVIYRELGFDAVADGAPDRDALLWRAAAERLRAQRRPGRTPCLVVRVRADDGVRFLARAHEWSLDGAPVSSPYIPGPHYASSVDERPALTAEGAAFVIALTPGAHRLDGTVRRFERDAPPRDEALALELTVADGEAVDCELVLTAARSALVVGNA